MRLTVYVQVGNEGNLYQVAVADAAHASDMTHVAECLHQVADEMVTAAAEPG